MQNPHAPNNQNGVAASFWVALGYLDQQGRLCCQVTSCHSLYHNYVTMVVITYIREANPELIVYS
jgi:hypothetical protein